MVHTSQLIRMYQATLVSGLITYLGFRDKCPRPVRHWCRSSLGSPNFPILLICHLALFVMHRWCFPVLLLAVVAAGKQQLYDCPLLN